MSFAFSYQEKTFNEQIYIKWKKYIGGKNKKISAGEKSKKENSKRRSELEDIKAHDSNK